MSALWCSTPFPSLVLCRVLCRFLLKCGPEMRTMVRLLMNYSISRYLISQKHSFLACLYMLKYVVQHIISLIQIRCLGHLWASKEPHTFINTLVTLDVCSTPHMRSLMNFVFIGRLPLERSPAARILFGVELQSLLAAEHSTTLQQEILALEPGITTWLPEDQTTMELGDLLLPDEDNGIILDYHSNCNCCKIVGFEPLGAFA